MASCRGLNPNPTPETSVRASARPSAWHLSGWPARPPAGQLAVCLPACLRPSRLLALLGEALLEPVESVWHTDRDLAAVVAAVGLPLLQLVVGHLLPDLQPCARLLRRARLALPASEARRSPLRQTAPDHVGVLPLLGGIAADALTLDAGRALAALALAHRVALARLVAESVVRARLAAHQPGAHDLHAVGGAHVPAIQGVLSLDGRARPAPSHRPVPRSRSALVDAEHADRSLLARVAVA
eukprot:12407528-Alexandrium_andersonii.AAC.1